MALRSCLKNTFEIGNPSEGKPSKKNVGFKTSHYIPVNLLYLASFLSRLTAQDDKFTSNNLTDDDVKLGQSFGMCFPEKTKDEIDWLKQDINMFLGRVFREVDEQKYTNRKGKPVIRLLFTDCFGNSILIVREGMGLYRTSETNVLSLAYKSGVMDCFYLEVKIDEERKFTINPHSWNKICEEQASEISLERFKVFFGTENPDDTTSNEPEKWKAILMCQDTKIIGRKVPKLF